MSGAIPPFPQYAFMACCSLKAQGQLYLYEVKAVIFKLQNESFASFMDNNV
jgi:hypothetical protein